MMVLLKHEWKQNVRNLLIWSLAVGAMGMLCICLFASMTEDMAELSESFSNMGAFSDAFGMSTLSIATLTGYFATEVGTVHGLGGGMFAAMLAIDIISKEEEQHSGEFLFSLPVSRSKVLFSKLLCVGILLVCFAMLCALFYLAGFLYLEEEVPEEFMAFILRQLGMTMEIAAICFGISAMSGKSKIGLGLGITLFFYFYDLLGRVVPDIEDYLFLGPYSYANASEIFTGVEPSMESLITAILVSLAFIGFGFFVFERRDLAS
jgi:ABC-2 type transport system permease protein